MCGICGQYNFMHEESVNCEVIKEMTNTIYHRGPDDEGYYISGPIGLGFRRLAIIDLEGGHQPMSDSQKTVWVVFNGEIYNFKELRKEIEADGYVFLTCSDTEVIVNGYKKWGVDVLDHLNGMFALAIWDVRHKRLMIARDRMGIKTVYYKIANGKICFASEIRGILANEGTKPEVDPMGMYLFLRYRYTPSPLTMFKGIKKLAPGTRIIIEKDKLNIERWWKFVPTPFDKMPTPREAQEQLLDLYSKALDRHLISDVPLGILLSGGLDSGLLLALMSRNGKKWNSYSIGFGKNTKDDEIENAAESARLFASTNYATQLTREEFDRTLLEIIAYVEEPVAAPSIVPMYHVCRRAREDVKVVLMGQGPDELFGGYKRHIGVQYGRYWRSLPSYIRSPISKILGNLPRNETIKRALYSLDIQERIKRYQEVFSIVPGYFMNNLFRSDILPANADERIIECWKDMYPMMDNLDELGGLQFLEVRSSLPDELLLYADKLSMAHSLEVRVPYLDKEIVEYAERLSSTFKIKKMTGKWLHRRVCMDFLPREIINRKKIGFVAPVDQWFSDSFEGKLDTNLLNEDSLIYGYIRFNKVKKLIEEHRQGKSNNFKLLFSLSVAEEWMRNYTS